MFEVSMAWMGVLVPTQTRRAPPPHTDKEAQAPFFFFFFLSFFLWGLAS